MQSDSSLVIRRLGPPDRDDVERLRLSRATVMGQPTGQVWSVPRFLGVDFDAYLCDSQRYVALGTFYEGQLTSYIMAIFEPKAWYVQYINSATRKDVSGPHMGGIAVMTDWMIHYAESRGIYEFWYALPNRYAKAHARVWRRLIPSLRPYHREDMVLVPRLTRPADEAIWKLLMSSTISQFDMLVRKNIKVQDSLVGI